MTLTPQEISDMKALATGLETLYGPYKTMCKRYEDIYFMDNAERPKGLDVDEGDVKVTISPQGRNDVTGLKRILDTGEIQIKVKSEDTSKADKIEEGLKTILRVSNERRIASVEKDENLASVLYGMSVLTVEGVDDLILSKTKDSDGNDKENVNKFAVRQLEDLKKRTPFLIGTVNPAQSYPEWGEYGLIGHLRKYDVRGNVLKERWGCQDGNVKTEQKYTVHDFFHYDKRLIWADGVNGELFADTWVDLESDDVAQLPVFVRYGGGSTLWYEPERQLHPFLYAKAKGEWDKRENLFWTYLFTAIFMQGLPGPTLVRDPEDTTPVTIEYDKGVKIITAKGKLENVSVIDGDVLQLKNLMDTTNASSTIRPEAFGAGADNSTFSGYVTSMNASKLPSEDPKEGIAMVFRDAMLYILKRIKAEGIENELIQPADIPDDIELEVTLEPNLTQDDLRNAQVVTNLKAANTNVSNEWLNTHILKIPNSEEMFKAKTKEDIRAAIVQQILANPELMKPMLMAAMGQKVNQQGSESAGQGQPMPSQDGMMPEGEPSQNGMTPEMMAQMQGGGGMPDPAMMEQMAQMQGQPGMEAMPKTDAMIPQSQRR
jgi:hypothetical protein